MGMMLEKTDLTWSIMLETEEIGALALIDVVFLMKAIFLKDASAKNEGAALKDEKRTRKPHPYDFFLYSHP